MNSRTRSRDQVQKDSLIKNTLTLQLDIYSTLSKLAQPKRLLVQLLRPKHDSPVTLASLQKLIQVFSMQAQKIQALSQQGNLLHDQSTKQTMLALIHAEVLTLDRLQADYHMFISQTEPKMKYSVFRAKWVDLPIETYSSEVDDTQQALDKLTLPFEGSQIDKSIRTTDLTTTMRMYHQHKHDFTYRTLRKKIFRSSALYKELTRQFINNLSKDQVGSAINAIKDTLHQAHPSESILAIKFLREAMRNRTTLFEASVLDMGLLEMVAEISRYRKESSSMKRGQYMFQHWTKQGSQNTIGTNSILNTTKQPLLQCLGSSSRSLAQQGHTLLHLSLESILFWACHHSQEYQNTFEQLLLEGVTFQTDLAKMNFTTPKELDPMVQMEMIRVRAEQLLQNIRQVVNEEVHRHEWQIRVWVNHVHRLASIATFWQHTITTPQYHTILYKIGHLEYLAMEYDQQKDYAQWKQKVLQTQKHQQIKKMIERGLQNDINILQVALRQRRLAVIESLVCTLEQQLHKGQSRKVLAQSQLDSLHHGLLVLARATQEKNQEVIARVHFRFIGLLGGVVAQMQYHGKQTRSAFYTLALETIRKWAIQISLHQPGPFRYNQFLIEFSRLSDKGVVFPQQYQYLTNDLEQSLSYMGYLFSGNLKVSAGRLVYLLTHHREAPLCLLSDQAQQMATLSTQVSSFLTLLHHQDQPLVLHDVLLSRLDRLDKMLAHVHAFQSGSAEYSDLRSALVEQEQQTEEKYTIHLARGGEAGYHSLKVPSKEKLVVECPEVESPQLNKKYSDLTTNETVLRSILTSDQVVLERQPSYEKVSQYVLHYQQKYSQSQACPSSQYSHPSAVQQLLHLLAALPSLSAQHTTSSLAQIQAHLQAPH